MGCLLKRLHKARAIMRIQMKDRATMFNSAIININNNANIFYLDELIPNIGHSFIEKGTLLNIDGRANGVEIKFNSAVEAVEDDNSIAMYRMPFPDQLVYLQRRRHFRAHLDNKEYLPIRISTPFKNKVNGLITDISTSGMCLKFNFKAANTLKQRDIIYGAQIMLPGTSPIDCYLDIRSVRHFPEKNYSLYGSEFHDISHAQQNYVDKLVASIDREQRRRSL